MICYYLIDSETNGLDSKKHEVNEISIIRYSDRVQLTQFIKCDNPLNSSYDALKITNKTLADLEKGSSKEEAALKILKFLNEDGLTPAHRCFIAHNAAFDRRFIHAMYNKINTQCPVDLWLCTIALIKLYLKQQGIKSLTNLHASCDVLGIKKLSEAHSSKVDTRNNYLLYKALVEDKKIDYLPFIKSFPHVICNTLENEGLDPDLLDI